MRIEKLVPSQRVQGRWLCTLDDGTLLRLGEGEVVRFALYAGMELTDALYDQLDEAARYAAVRERALDLIAARPLSRRELLDKLTAKPRDPKKRPADPAQALQPSAELFPNSHQNAPSGRVWARYKGLSKLRKAVPTSYSVPSHKCSFSCLVLTLNAKTTR